MRGTRPRRLGPSVLGLLLLARSAGADEDPPAPPETSASPPTSASVRPPASAPAAPRWGLGLSLGALNLPGGHVGVPLPGGTRLPLALTLRRQIDGRSALSLGVGAPHSSLGLSAWAGYETFVSLLADRRRLVALELHQAGGVQLGFAGPDFAARHTETFVGFGYIYQGPLAFGLRLPAGLRLRLVRGRFDVTLESVSILTFTPAVEAFFGLSAGARVYF